MQHAGVLSQPTRNPWRLESYHGHSVVASRAIVRFKTPPSADTLARVRAESDPSSLAAVGHSGWYVLDSDPAPTIRASGSAFTGGTGPTRPQ